MKNVFFRFIFSLLLLFTFVKTVSAQEIIEEMNSTVRVDTTGKIYVEETILYNTGAANKHGIFRIIPFKKQNEDGKKFSLKFDDFSVVDAEGTNHKFTKTTDYSAGTIELKIGDPDATFSGLQVYNIKYSVSGAITYFEDHDEIFWNFTGNEWPFPIKKSINRIILPESISYEDAKALCYTGLYGESLEECEVTPTKEGILFSNLYTLEVAEGITGALGFPKGYVATLFPEEDKPGLLFYAFIAFFAFMAFSWYILLPIKVALKRGKIKKYNVSNKREVAAWFDPPKGRDGKPLSPGEVGVLIDKKPDNKEITATIIDLAKRGYFKISQSDKNFIFERSQKTDDLKGYESLLLNGLFASGNTVDTKELKKSTTFGSKAQIFLTDIVTALEKQNFYEGDLSNFKAKNIIFIVFSALTANLPLFLVLLYFRNYYIQYTPDGIKAFSEAKSLENFLKSQSTQLDFQSKNLMFFEKLLPYATAFGAEKVWADKFKDIGELQTDWYSGDLANMAAFSHMASTVGSTVNSSMRYYTSSTSSSGFSSGFSSGGGFSGGGGGGGGGGSW